MRALVTPGGDGNLPTILSQSRLHGQPRPTIDSNLRRNPFFGSTRTTVRLLWRIGRGLLGRTFPVCLRQSSSHGHQCNCASSKSRNCLSHALHLRAYPEALGATLSNAYRLFGLEFLYISCLYVIPVPPSIFAVWTLFRPEYSGYPFPPTVGASQPPHFTSF